VFDGILCFVRFSLTYDCGRWKKDLCTSLWKMYFNRIRNVVSDHCKFEPEKFKTLPGFWTSEIFLLLATELPVSCFYCSSYFFLAFLCIRARKFCRPLIQLRLIFKLQCSRSTCKKWVTGVECALARFAAFHHTIPPPPLGGDQSYFFSDEAEKNSWLLVVDHLPGNIPLRGTEDDQKNPKLMIPQRRSPTKRSAAERWQIKTLSNFRRLWKRSWEGSISKNSAGLLPGGSP
jgi:hypothetical protein